MRTGLATGGMLIALALVSACGNGNDRTIGDPDAKIDDVEVFLARVCEEAALCPGLAPTQDEIDRCPLGIRSELSSNQLAEIERFLTYTKVRQDCILRCIGSSICNRFGGALSNISDSDAIEPLLACEQQCRQ